MPTKKKIVKTVDRKEVSATAKYVRVSPYKLRKVADHVRRSNNVTEALNQLRLMHQKSAVIMFKVLKSCVAN